MLQKRVTLVNIYGPSTGDNPLFFEKVYEIINEIGNDVNIIGGDWNCVLNAEIDTINYTNTRARLRSHAKILSSMSKFDLVDAFRELYPNKKEYTWRRFNTNKRGRLDFFSYQRISWERLRKQKYVQAIERIIHWSSLHSGGKLLKKTDPIGNLTTHF